MPRVADTEYQRLRAKLGRRPAVSESAIQQFLDREKLQGRSIDIAVRRELVEDFEFAALNKDAIRLAKLELAYYRRRAADDDETPEHRAFCRNRAAQVAASIRERTKRKETDHALR